MTETWTDAVPGTETEGVTTGTTRAEAEVDLEMQSAATARSRLQRNRLDAAEEEAAAEAAAEAEAMAELERLHTALAEMVWVRVPRSLTSPKAYMIGRGAHCDR